MVRAGRERGSTGTLTGALTTGPHFLSSNEFDWQIAEPESSGKPATLHVNFDPELMLLLREVHYLAGAPFGLRLPDPARVLLRSTDDGLLRSTATRLETIVSRYNSIAKNMEPYETPLFERKLAKIDEVNAANTAWTTGAGCIKVGCTSGLYVGPSLYVAVSLDVRPALEWVVPGISHIKLSLAATTVLRHYLPIRRWFYAWAASYVRNVQPGATGVKWTLNLTSDVSVSLGRTVFMQLAPVLYCDARAPVPVFLPF